MHRNSPMRQKGYSINMYAPVVGSKVARHFLILRGTVGNISQKMSNWGLGVSTDPDQRWQDISSYLGGL